MTGVTTTQCHKNKKWWAIALVACCLQMPLVLIGFNVTQAQPR